MSGRHVSGKARSRVISKTMDSVIKRTLLVFLAVALAIPSAPLYALGESDDNGAGSSGSEIQQPEGTEDSDQGLPAGEDPGGNSDPSEFIDPADEVDPDDLDFDPDAAAGLISPLGLIITGDTAIVSGGVWEDFWTAWNNPAVSVIEVTDSITRNTTGANTNPYNRLPALTRDLRVVGTGPGININFGTDNAAANVFTLGNRTAAQPATFSLENISVTHASAAVGTAIINSAGSAANTAGWTVIVSNVSYAGTPTGALVSVSGADVYFAGNVVWQTNTNSIKVQGNSLTLAPGAQVYLSKSLGGTNLISLEALTSGLTIGDGAGLYLSGGATAVNFNSTGNVQNTVSVGTGATLSIVNATNGIMMVNSPTNNAANFARYIFGPDSVTNISVTSTALLGTGAEFQAGAIANLTASNTATGAATLVDFNGTRTLIPLYFNVYDGAQVTLSAQGGNCLDVGNSNAAHSANIRVTNGSRLTATGRGNGGGNTNAVILAQGAAGGFTVTGGSVLEAHSTYPNGGYPAVVEQIPGGTFLVDGEGSKLILSQVSSFSGYTAVLRFRIVGDQTFDVRNGGSVEITKPRNSDSTANRSAAIRFGNGTGNSFIISSGGHVKVYNGGNGTYDTATDATGGNEAIEYNAGNFSFSLSGTGPTGPSSCELIADYGPAIDAGGYGGGSINIGPGTIFIAQGATGNTTFPTINATGSGFEFSMNYPLYYDFVNRRPGGGAVFNLGSGAQWSSTNSDVAVWIAGRNVWSGNPERSYTLIDYSLTKTGTTQTTWNWVSGDSDFQAWWNADATHRMGSYTRISANNAPPRLDATIPATNADLYVRWTGMVPEGFDQNGRPFWDDEVYAIVRVIKVDGTTFDVLASLTQSVFEESLYTVETGVMTLDGVLRLEKDGTEAGNTDIYLEAGDSYQVMAYWRGNPDPTSPKRHVSTDFSNTGPIVVTDKVPPLPATSILPVNFYANQRNLSGTWVQADNDNPPVSISAQIYRDGSWSALPGSGIVYSDGTWTFSIDTTYTLQGDDVIAIVFTDANGNSEPVVDTPLHDMMVPAAANITVQGVVYDIEAENAIIGLSDAMQITTPAELLALIEAEGFLLVPTKTSVPVEIKTTDFLYGAAATPGDYYVTVKITDVDFEETFYVTVRPGEVIRIEDYFIEFQHITERKNWAWATSVTNAELMIEGKVAAYRIEGWVGGALVTSPATAEYVSRNFTNDDIANDYFIARVFEKPAIEATIRVNLSDNYPVLTVLSPKIVAVDDPFPVGAPDDTEPSYLQGVFASDVEDDWLSYLDVVFDDSIVDTSVDEAVYTVTYSITDSDHNTTTATGLVLIGDWDVIDGYAIMAKDFTKSIGDVLGTEAEVLAESHAKAIDTRVTLPNGDPNPNFGQEVAVIVTLDGGYYAKTPGVFTITLAVAEHTAATKDITATVSAGGSPVITFTEKPLVIDQTPLVHHILSAEELKDYLEVTDAEDYPVWISDTDGRAQDLFTTLVVTPFGEDGQPTTIDTAYIGVYRVRYTATDKDGNSTDAYRAVVIDDGRYIIEDETGDGENDIIIGARNFVVKQVNVQRSESAIASLSYPEAFDSEGNRIPVTLNAAGIPAGYTTGTAAPGTYAFTWVAAGHPTTKPITGLVVIADELDPGTKDSQYAIYASNFMVNTQQAADIIANTSYVTFAQAYVVSLVGSAPARPVAIVTTGGFSAAQGTYPITFKIGGTPDIPAVVQQVRINGVVSNGKPPLIDAPTPINIWIGPAAEKPLGAIDPGDYSIMYLVSATDPDGGGKDPDIPLDITADVTATAVGAAVDTTSVGTYVVHFEVTDSDNNTVSVDRLVVVNDGRYEVGKGRVLYAKPFVIKLSAVATTASGRLTQVGNLTDATLYAGDNESSAVHAGDALPADQITFAVGLGGYGPVVGVYDIGISAKDYSRDGSAVPDITRTVVAEVVDADVIEEGPGGETEDSYYIFGNNIVLTPARADAIQTGGNLESDLIAELAASARLARPNGSLETLTVKIIDYDGFDTRPVGVQAIGSYTVTITDAGDNITAELSVTVALGDLPVLTALPKPLVFPITSTPGTLTLSQLMSGVTATDTEDDLAGLPLTVTIVGGTPTIATDVASVTKVTYTVTDSAGNTVYTSRAVIIDDGSYTWNDAYILRANSFIINVADVAPTNKNVQIRTLSGARAWTSEGDAVATNRIDVDEAGYAASVADYKPILTLTDDTSVSRTIAAKVVSDTKEVENGVLYSIFADDPFIINVQDANALAATSAANIESVFLTKAGVMSYKRSGLMDFPAGTRQLVSAFEHGSTSVSFADRAGTLQEGDRFDVTFWVSEDHTATVTVTLLVSNRTAPVLTVPAVKIVPVGNAFPQGSFADVNPSYMQGVVAYDAEDTALNASNVQHDYPVNTSIDGASYVVTYSVTDSDHNTTTAEGLVLIGDWTIIGNYAFNAHGFTKNLTDVLGTEAEVLAESQARAIDVRPFLANGVPNPNFGASVKVVVTDNGGYYSKTSSAHLPNGFEIVLAVDADRTSNITINALVNDNRVSLTYYANGGSGTPPATVLSAPGGTVAVSDQNTLSRSGYTFGGWSFLGNGGAAYQAGQTFRIYENTRLYAVWNAIPPVTPPPTIIVNPPTVIYPPAGPTIYVPVPGETVVIEQPANIIESPDLEVPLALPEDPGRWSLADLICTMLMVLVFLLALIRVARRPKNDDYGDGVAEDNRGKRHSWLSRLLFGLGAVAAVIGLVLFILTQDLSLPMTLFDYYSVFFISLLIIELVSTIALFVSVYISDNHNRGDESNSSDIESEAGKVVALD